ncbi:hypothetical protein EVAR_31617_1 [Eumeta japonica]|uniref:Uncharacterized protein n=1 Tax=Eumeta variegata TaxID=151549 RepID=A0A4C1VZE2_EUMVA|nr:hypothetical protein EVAR_31617_1 [Eumeta japonica]
MRDTYFMLFLLRNEARLEGPKSEGVTGARYTRYESGRGSSDVIATSKVVERAEPPTKIQNNKKIFCYIVIFS